MASYQDLDIRVKIIEDKLALIMQVAQVTVGTPSTIMPGEVVKKQISMGELYQTIKQTGADLVAASEDN
jgi:hypothetical protein